MNNTENTSNMYKLEHDKDVLNRSKFEQISYLEAIYNDCLHEYSYYKNISNKMDKEIDNIFKRIGNNFSNLESSINVVNNNYIMSKSKSKLKSKYSKKKKS